MSRATWGKCNQKVQRGILPHCLGPMRQNSVLCPNWGSPVWGRHWYTGTSPMEAMEVIGSWSTLCPRGGCGCWVCSAWEGMDLGDLTGIYKCPKEKKIWRQTSQRITVTGWQATIPSWYKTILMKVMYFFHSDSGEALGQAHQRGCKNSILGDTQNFTRERQEQPSLTVLLWPRWLPEVTANLNDSVIVLYVFSMYISFSIKSTVLMFLSVQAIIRKHIENCQMKNQENSGSRQVITWTFGTTSVVVKHLVDNFTPY